MQRLVKDLIVTACGALTSLLTALLMVWLELTFQIAVYGFNVMLFFPLGAMLAGGLASLGYYVGAKLFGARPSRFIMMNMVAVSVATFLLIKYIPYYDFTSRLPPGQAFPSFWEYLHQRIVQTRLAFNRGNVAAPRMGLWGYPYTMIQVMGFAGGGFFVYGWLAASPYCESCQRYLSAFGTWKRHWDQAPSSPKTEGSAEDLDEDAIPPTPASSPPDVAVALEAAVKDGDPVEIVESFAETGQAKAGAKGGFVATLKIYGCKSCNLKHFELNTLVGEGEARATVAALCHSQYTDDDLPLPAE